MNLCVPLREDTRATSGTRAACWLPLLYTDECRFTRDAVLNSWNSHVWDDENPHAQHAHGFQQRFGINVWADIVDGRYIGPYLLPPRLTGHNNLIFLQEVLGELLEAVSLDIRRLLWFQLDGAPLHFVGAVRDQLNKCFGREW